jgi:alpha-L-fucosidase
MDKVILKIVKKRGAKYFILASEFIDSFELELGYE